MELKIPKIAAWALFLPERLHGHHTGFVPAFPAQPCNCSNLFPQIFVPACEYMCAVPLAQCDMLLPM